MKLRVGMFAAVFGAALLGASGANAGALYVGSWEVDQGPAWYNQPTAYTGQEAAALLFGGSANDYLISTVNSNPADINGMAWYSILGHGGGTQFAQNYVASGSDQCCGLYYSGGGYQFNDPNEAASAYVWDNAQGPEFTNYAFRENVPEPLTISLFSVGLAGAVAMRRRRKTVAA